MMTPPPPKYLNVLRLLRLLGVEVHEDWDRELIVTVPERLIGPAALRGICATYREHIARELHSESDCDRRRAMGGPFAGQLLSGLILPGMLKVIRYRPRQWAVYRCIDHDGRIVFIGYATSQAKGRKGIVSNATKTN